MKSSKNFGTLSFRCDSISDKIECKLGAVRSASNLSIAIDYNYGMSTTVEVKRSTLQMLEELKRKFKARSIDETIRKLIVRVQGVPESKFGAHPQMKPFTSRDEATDHKL